MEFVQKLSRFSTLLNGLAWGPATLVMLVGIGVYLSLRTGFMQLFRAPSIARNTVATLFRRRREPNARRGAISPFQALTTALAATAGTGNIVGVATAIASGGPGAIFWMWVSAFFGMMTKYAEIVLAVKYRRRNEKGEFVGGPMYYIEQGLHMKWLARLFSVFGVCACFGIGNMTQVNSIAGAMEDAFGVRPIVTGLVVAALTTMVLLGGITRIARVTEKFVPVMAVLYSAAAFAVVVMNWRALPEAVGLIFQRAFTPTAAAGGFLGSALANTIQKGVARGVFSNEAGLGSAPIAHAAADTDSAVRQGMWGIFEVFVDTIVMCTCTALVLLTTGAWRTGADGAALTIAAFSMSFHEAAGGFLAFCIFFFAFSTLVSWGFYGEKCLEYLMGTTRWHMAFRAVFVAVILLGAVTSLEIVWQVADTLNGFMALPNLVALIFLSGSVVHETKAFFAGALPRAKHGSNLRKRS